MAEQRIYQNETIYLPDLARTNATVTATFQDCEIRGPAVVVLLGNTVVDGPTFGVADDDIESILFEAQEGFKVGNRASGLPDRWRFYELDRLRGHEGDVGQDASRDPN